MTGGGAERDIIIIGFSFTQMVSAFRTALPSLKVQTENAGWDEADTSTLVPATSDFSPPCSIVDTLQTLPVSVEEE